MYVADIAFAREQIRRYSLHCRLAAQCPPVSCLILRYGPLAQWQSSGLLIRWLEVRLLRGPLRRFDLGKRVLGKVPTTFLRQAAPTLRAAFSIRPYFGHHPVGNGDRGRIPSPTAPKSVNHSCRNRSKSNILCVLSFATTIYGGMFLTMPGYRYAVSAK